MRLGIDIDDVLFPWFTTAHAICEAAGITNGVVPSSWTCHEDYGCTLQEWLDVLAAATRDGSLYAGAPIPGSVEALHRLADAGHSLHIITARGFFAHGDLIRRHTVEWLADYGVPHDSLTFVKDKTLVRVDAAVDDSWKNVQALTAAGVPTWLVDAPHNQDAVHHTRVPSVVEFAEAILSKKEPA
jgi:5'(3')-deoxyribonucleotidase